METGRHTVSDNLAKHSAVESDFADIKTVLLFRPQQMDQTENRTCELGNSCRKRRCADSHAKTCDKKEVQHNIDARGYDQINQRMAAVSYGLQDTDKNVIHYKAERTGKVGSEICNRLRQNIGRRSHQYQNFRCQVHAGHRQDQTGCQAECHSRVDRLLQFFVIFLPIISRNHDTGTHGNAINKAHHQKNQISG